jgi:predicted transcriptional regulator
MNQEQILEILPSSEANARSVKEIAEVMGLNISSYATWRKTERGLSNALRKLMKWGFVARERRQSCIGHKFWYNVYWRTEVVVHEESMAIEVMA